MSECERCGIMTVHDILVTHCRLACYCFSFFFLGEKLTSYVLCAWLVSALVSVGAELLKPTCTFFSCIV